MLGPFRLVGWPDGQPRSAPVVELACYLALHPGRRYSAEELRHPLSLDKTRALEADSVRTYAGTLRRVLGGERLPDVGRKGYALVRAGSDWHRFSALLPPAGVGDAAEQAAVLARALSLVRGEPFSELPPTGFGWVATELLLSEVEVAVIAAARRLADLALDAGDGRLAGWACGQGLLVSPTEQELNAGALRAAAAGGNADTLAQAWRDVARRFAAAGDPLPEVLKDQHRLLSRPTSSR